MHIPGILNALAFCFCQRVCHLGFLIAFMCPLYISGNEEYSIEQFLIAVSADDVEQVKLFLEADPTLVNQFPEPRWPSDLGSNAIDYSLCAAVHTYDIQLVQLLVNRGADVNAKDNYGCTALHWAVRRNQINICNFLLDHGADVSLLDRNKMTALHLAARFDCPEITQSLLDHKANPNPIGEYEYSPLECAVYNGNNRSAGILLKYGADLTIVNDQSKTLWEFCTSKLDFDSEIPFLSQLKPKPSIPNKHIGNMVHLLYQYRQMRTNLWLVCTFLFLFLATGYLALRVKRKSQLGNMDGIHDTINMKETDRPSGIFSESHLASESSREDALRQKSKVTKRMWLPMATVGWAFSIGLYWIDPISHFFILPELWPYAQIRILILSIAFIFCVSQMCLARKHVSKVYASIGICAVSIQCIIGYYDGIYTIIVPQFYFLGLFEIMCCTLATIAIFCFYSVLVVK